MAEDKRTILGTRSNARWLRRILFPFWICRILLLVVMSVAQVATVYWISQELDIKGAVLASLIVVVLFAVLCISMDSISLILLGRDALTPRGFFTLQCSETLLWTGVVGAQIAAGLRASSNSRSFLPWLVSAIL